MEAQKPIAYTEEKLNKKRNEKAARPVNFINISEVVTAKDFRLVQDGKENLRLTQ